MHKNPFLLVSFWFLPTRSMSFIIEYKKATIVVKLVLFSVLLYSQIRCMAAFIFLNITEWFVSEPRGSSQDSFEATLKEYYNYIRHGTQNSKGKKIRGRTLGFKNSNLLESMKDIKKEGATFLAVCRGKVI